MPIRVTIDQFNRVVIGVGDGVLTIPDLASFGLEVLHAKVVHYARIIDVSQCQPDFSRTELLAFARVARETQTNLPRGPLALVVDPRRGEMAKLFADLAMEGRSVEVFRSIHNARRWLAAQQHAQGRDDQR
jgi:hypothetical protein